MAVKTINAEVDGRPLKITADIPDDATPAEIEEAVRAHMSAPAPAPAPAGGNSQLAGAAARLADVPIQSLSALKAFFEPLNPGPAIAGIYQAARHPFQTAADVLYNVPMAKIDESARAFGQGDYAGAAQHAVGIVPFVGPIADQMIGRYRSGDTGGAIGGAAGNVAAGAATLKAMQGARRGAVTLVPALRNSLTPAEASAAAYGQREGVRMDTATETGSRLARNAQKHVQESVGGAGYSQAARQSTNADLERAGERLAQRTYQTPVVPEQAGAGVRSSLEGDIRQFNTQAAGEYGTFREIEADPANTHTVYQGAREVPGPHGTTRIIEPQFEDVPLPVNNRSLKELVRPIYEQKKRLMPIAEQRSDPGMHIMEQILAAPDWIPASIAEENLGALKEAARSGNMPELAGIGKGLARRVITEYDQAIRDAVLKAKRSAPEGTPAAPANVTPISGAPTNAEAPAPQPGAARQGPAVYGPTQPGARQIRGTETRLTVPGEQRAYKANYEVRELEDVKASHNEHTFQPNEGYGLRNDRNYSKPENQRKIVDWSSEEQFDPSYHITDNPDAVNGPVVIDPEGNALGGNGRRMILGRVYERNGKAAAAYKQLLIDRAEQYGLDPIEVSNMRRPVLVRRIADAELELPGATQRAVTDFNKTGTAALTPAERAIADSRQVSPATLDTIGQRMETAGKDATLLDMLERGENGPEVLQQLIKDGVISPQETAALQSGGVLTPAGKQRIAQLMLGRFFEDPAQLEAIAPSIRAKLERIAAPLARVEAQPGWNLSEYVQEATSLLHDAQAAGMPLEEFLKQKGLFAEQQYAPEVLTLAKHLRDTNPNHLVNAVRQYAADSAYTGGGEGLFGPPPTPEQAFQNAFGGQVSSRAAGPAPARVPKPSAAFERETAPTAPLPPRPTIPAGPEAMGALERGRRATAQKYDYGETLRQLREEPVQAYQQLTYAKDSGIEFLRDVAKKAPAELAKIGRAYIEGLLQRGAESGFETAKGMLRDWQKLGPETKKLLFQHDGLVQDLNDFFQLAEMVARNPNPSGTARLVHYGATAGLLISNPAGGAALLIGESALARLLFSPKGAAVLKQGLKVPAGNKAAGAIAAAKILELAGKEARPLRLAAEAQAPERSASQQP